MDGENQVMDGPQDISQAFQMLRQGKQNEPDDAQQTQESGVPEGTVDEGGQSPDEGQPQDTGVSGTGTAVPGDEVGTDEQSAGIPDGTGVGGSSDDYEEYDYQGSRNQLMQSLQQQAARDTAAEFQKHGVKPWSIQDIYSRDEDGTVHFSNPDDPHREFSSRAEAQAWVESMNKEVQRTFNQEVAKRQQELYRQAAPAIMLLEFAPSYDAMDDDTKVVFNDLVEPYSVYNNAGDIVGFSCNLNQMAQQAANIVSRFGSKQQSQQAKPQTNPAEKHSEDQSPALDIKTGNGQAAEEEEPKTIEEAMAMLNKRKEKKNG